MGAAEQRRRLRRASRRLRQQDAFEAQANLRARYSGPPARWPYTARAALAEAQRRGAAQ